MARKVEIETKFAVDDFEEIRKILTSVQAKWLGDGKEENIYFENLAENLAGQKKVLRLRKWRSTARLTFKRTLKNDKKCSFRDEAEVVLQDVHDFPVLRDMMLGLGFVEDVRYEKNREMWLFRGTIVCLDQIEDGRMFVEIEGVRRKITHVAYLFDLDWGRVEKKSYPEIIKELRKKK